MDVVGVSQCDETDCKEGTSVVGALVPQVGGLHAGDPGKRVPKSSSPEPPASGP